MTVGSSINATCLTITGPYASISGNLWVGTDLQVLRNASVSGTIAATGGFRVGTIQVIDQYGTVLTGISAAGGITTATISGSYLSIHDSATILGSVYVGSDLESGRNITAAATLAGSCLNITGAYASLSNLLVNNVFGSLIWRGYDESGAYKLTTATTNQPLPGAFLSRAIASTQVSVLDFTSATVGSLSSQYSVRISGYVQPPVSGLYTFRFTYKDGVSVWIGPDKLLDSWTFLNTPSTTTSSLIMKESMWTPIIIEHACAVGNERLLIEYSTNGTSYVTLQHVSDGSNFRFAYDLYDVPPSVLGTTYNAGKSFFLDESIFSAGISLSNALLFSGNTSELSNDAGFLTSTPATLSGQAMYVASFASISGTIAGSGGSFTALTVAGSTKMTGALEIGTAASQLRLLPMSGTGESSIAFYRNAGKTISATGDLWTMGNSAAGQTAGGFSMSSSPTTGLFLTPGGSLGVSQPNPTAVLDVNGAVNFAGSLTLGGGFSMTSAVGVNNLYTSNALVAAGAVVVGNSANALANLPVDLYPGVDNRSKCGTANNRWTGLWSYNLDVSGNSLMTGSLTLGGTNIKQYLSIPLTVSPVSADVPAVNPDALPNVLINEDGNNVALTTGILSGAATYGTTTYSTTRCVQLTSNVSSTSGSVSWPLNPGSSWILNAETYVGGGTGAELIGFFVYSSTATGPGSGYAFIADEYSNVNNGNTSAQFSILYNGSAVSSVAGTSTGGTFLIPLAQWNNIKIIFVRNTIRVFINNALAVSFRDTNRAIIGDNTYYCGFYGQCTTNNNYHAVRNIRLTKFSDSVWSHTNITSNDIGFVGGKVGINTLSPDVPLTVAVNETTVSNNGILLSLKANNPIGSALTVGRDVGLSFMQTGVNAYGIVQRGGSSSSGGSAGRLAFVSNMSSGSAGTEQLSLLGNGNLGVGTTTPGFTLDVNGNCRLNLGGDSTFYNSSNASQLLFGYRNNAGYCHAIKTRHDGSSSSGNALDFWVFNFGTDSSTSTAPSRQVMSICGNGAVGINQVSPQFSLDVTGTARFTSNLTVPGFSSGGTQMMTINTGSVTVQTDLFATGNITAFSNSSDKKLKDNIADLFADDVIQALRPVTFTWKQDIYYEKARGQRDVGLIAQEVADVFPLAHGNRIIDDEVIETVSYEKMIPLLLASVKSLLKRVKTLEAK